MIEVQRFPKSESGVMRRAHPPRTYAWLSARFAPSARITLASLWSDSVIFAAYGKLTVTPPPSESDAVNAAPQQVYGVDIARHRNKSALSGSNLDPCHKTAVQTSFLSSTSSSPQSGPANNSRVEARAQAGYRPASANLLPNSQRAGQTPGSHCRRGRDHRPHRFHLRTALPAWRPRYRVREDGRSAHRRGHG